MIQFKANGDQMFNVKISSRQPGVDLDKEVGEKIFGYTFNSSNNSWKIDGPPGVSVFAKHLPKYSTDLSDANLVVNKIETMSEAVKLAFYSKYKKFDLEKAVPGVPVKPVEHVPFEICVAALEAIKLSAGN